jgi:hypothetical protein
MMANTMTGARHERKPPFSGLRPGLAAVLLGVLALIGPSGAATTEQVVVDRHTGLAISGFDPVAYFTDGSPSLGRPDFEYRFAGAVWRFRNEGNRAAFMTDGAVYMPRYGGYDPMALARAVALPGDPRLWLVFGERLYLFHSPETRAVFAADSAAAIASADRHWRSVERQLSP